MSESDARTLVELEEGLWRAETRQSPDWMDRVLAEDFIEFGASGRRYERAEILQPASGSLDVVLPLPEYAVRFLGDDVALATYVSVQVLPEGGRRVARRSSVWRREPDGWKLAFHQGTLLPTESV